MIQTNSRRPKNNVLIVVLIVVVVLALAVAGYFAYKYINITSNPSVAQANQSREVDTIKGEVGKLILLPSDETPTLATVSDITKLKDQPFFKDAKNGDKILIFPQAKKAIIYREDINKLVNVGPIAITSDVASGVTEKK